MKQLTALFLVAAAACGNATFPDETEPTDPMDPGPDAGMTEPPIDPPIDPAMLSIVPHAVFDERADVIGFSSGEPLHLHTGSTVMLGAAGCPDLARYAYLLDRQVVYGKNSNPNPLAINVALPDGLLPESAEYRVNVGNDSFSAWTAVPGAAGERATIALYRDDIPALGTFDGQIRVEVRARVTGDVEQTATACWTHHPLLAPVAIAPPVPATGTGSLAGVRLTTSQALGLLPDGAGSPPIDAISIAIDQQTVEPLKLEVKLAAPAGTYTVTVADAYVQTEASTLAKNCDLEGEYCDWNPVPDPADVTRSGTLATGTWVVHVREDGGLPVECPQGVCMLPGRAPGTPVRHFHVVAMLRDVGQLWPVTTPAAATSVAAGPLVGGWLPDNTAVRCKQAKMIGDVVACVSWVQYTELQALDRARLALESTAIHLAVAPGSGAQFAPVPYVAGSTLTAPGFLWDGGDGPL